MSHVQGTLRETETRRTVQVLNVPAMKTASGSYEFFPRTMEIVYRTQEAPDGGHETSVKVSGPVILDDGSVSVSWTSRRFFGDLGIDGGARWIRQFVESFRPFDGNAIGTDTLLGDAEDWG